MGLQEGHTAKIADDLKKRPDAGFDAETLAKIMRFTGVNPLWLLYGEEPRLVDATHGDPELAVFLAAIDRAKDLRLAAAETHAKVSEIKAILRLLDQRALLPYSPSEGGAIDWKQVIHHFRDGKFRPSATQSVEGTDRARDEQERQHGGPLPSKIELPPARRSRRK